MNQNTESGGEVIRCAYCGVTCGADEEIEHLRAELEQVKGELAKVKSDEFVMVDYKEFRKTCDDLTEQNTTLKHQLTQLQESHDALLGALKTYMKDSSRVTILEWKNALKVVATAEQRLDALLKTIGKI